MKHPDWPLFLAAIVAEPDEDTPRLVAADFLEENGEPHRATFIRLQIELARLVASGLGQSQEADRLRKKERTFLGPTSDYALLWGAEECSELVHMPGNARTTSPLIRVNVEGADRLTWRRGFVEAVWCPATEWLRHGVTVRSRSPVRDVYLVECRQVTREDWYAGLNTLRGLRTVVVMQPDNLRVAEELANWLRPWLPGSQVNHIPF